MAVLEKIRVKMGVFITVLIALALLSFIIDPSTLQSAMSMFSSKYDVGEMNGKGISYQDFQKKVDYFTQIYQITSGSANSDEKTQDMLNNSAWQSEIAQNVLIPAAEDAGLRIGEDEMFDMSQGNGISPIIANEPSFRDQNGAFNKEKVVEFVKAIDQDNTGNLKMYWSYLENNMKVDQMLSKYISLLDKSNITNPVEVKRAIAENNTSYAVSFVVKPFGFQMDSTIAVNSSEIKEYYDKHKKVFKQPASRDLSYVVFEVTPSDKDIKEAEESIQKAMDGFLTATNMKTFLARSSDRPFNKTYFKEGEIASYSQELEDFAKSASIGSVLPYFKNEDAYIAAKVTDIKSMPDSVFVKHILLQGESDKKADSLMAVLNSGADFVTLAKQYSADQNPNVAEPGDLGWLTQQYMVPGFESVFSEPIGKVVVMKTNYGVHLVKVTKATAPVRKVQMALLVKEINPSKQTYAEFYSKASDFAGKCEGSLEKFNKTAKTENLYTRPAQRVLPGAKTLANYEHTREITRWANEHKVGEVSPIITVDNKYFFVVALTGVHEEGIAPIKEIAPQIKSVLMMEKRNDKILKETEVAVKGLTSLDQIAEKLGTTVSNQTGVTFSSLTSQQLDPKFVGAVAGSPINKIMGPVKGDIGIFYYMVSGQEKGAFYTAKDAKQKKVQQFTYIVRMLPDIMSEGKVKDERYRFY
jgi:peptidyl-prolyl cis-trans isomerase D